MAFPLQTYGLFSFQLPLFPSICDIIARVHLISGRMSVSYGLNMPYLCDMLQQVKRTNERTHQAESKNRPWNDLIILVALPPGFEPGTFKSAVSRSTSVLSCHTVQFTFTFTSSYILAFAISLSKFHNNREQQFFFMVQQKGWSATIQFLLINKKSFI